MKDLPDHYQIKFRAKGKKGTWMYGIFQTFGEDVKELWKTRQVLIADAVLPETYQVPYNEIEIVDIPLGIPEYDKETGTFKPGDELDEYAQKEYKKAKEKAAKSKTLKDKLFKVGVADGYAMYIVIKENKKTVKVEWRGFAGGDRYTDSVLGWECTVDKDRIAQMVKREESPLFGSSRK